MKRELTFALQKFRAEKTDAGHRISGYAALYNVLSQPIYYVYDSEGKRKAVREKLAPGAFDEALRDADCTCNINHDDDRLLGRTGSGTLKLNTDDLGLGFENDVPDTTYARDLGILMQRGDIRDCSFAFTVDEADIERSVEGDYIVETIRKIKRLYDVAIVTRGAYPQPFSVFRELPKDGEVFAIQNLSFRYSTDGKPAPGTREGEQSSEPTAQRTLLEQRRTLELARLDLSVKTMEVLA